MFLHGSCHCGAVRFNVESPHPYPYQRCYCSICRKTAGGGGYAINLSGRAETLQVEGAEHKRVYHAIIDGEPSSGERHFCQHCASALWVFDPGWPELVHPFASAIDSELPIPPERVHLLLASKANWVEVTARENDKCFDDYPEESIAEWHRRLGLDESEKR
ncbi:GFA family protein [Billgrantia endophytica]|uniref:Alanine acetyltransferase n=1 Tax=Billgrantia endophytica TaxID=2033802 RepID=A0A2N7TZJ6_9GAMM|nr:GFA family protein [Halomonas endophytica]PMR73601.1 alanine acetyltransferase [Halomonas endophytica]